MSRQGRYEDNSREEQSREIARVALIEALPLLTQLLPFRGEEGALGRAFEIALAKANSAAIGYVEKTGGGLSAA